MLSNCGAGEDFESPLDSKEINKPVNPKGSQPWTFTGRTDAEAEASILWPPDVKSWLTGKDSDAEKDWRQEEKGKTEDEMVGWHQWLNGHESEQVSELVMEREAWCDAVYGVVELDTTERLNWTKEWELDKSSVVQAADSFCWLRQCWGLSGIKRHPN